MCTQYLQNVGDAWALVKTLVDIPDLPQPAHEQRSVPAMQKAFMNQARLHLERRFVSENMKCLSVVIHTWT